MNAVHAPIGPGRLPLFALASLALASVAVVAFVRLTGVGAVTSQVAPALVERALRFEDRPDGSIVVFDAGSGAIAATVAPGGDGFLRGTMRGLARERHRRGLSPAAPFELVVHVDGRFTLEDPASGRRIDLGSFGPTNAAAFARLMAGSAANQAQP